MDNLLPPNATPLERNLATVNAAIGSLPVPLRDLTNADTCPADVLPWLAAYLSVDAWDVNWTEEQSRAAIRASFDVHRRKGTIGAVRRALNAMGIGAQLQEWFNQIPAGAPYTFRLLITADQVGYDATSFARIREVAGNAKNLRSHLSEIVPQIVTRAAPSIAAVTGIGTEITVKFDESRFALVMEGSRNGMEATEAAVIRLIKHVNETMPRANYW